MAIIVDLFALQSRGRVASEAAGGQETVYVLTEYTRRDNPDPLVNLAAAVLSCLRDARANNDLKDGNITVKNVWDSLDWDNPSPQHLPLIQFGYMNAGAGSYATDSVQLIPFQMRFIVWVHAGADRIAAEKRCSALRQHLFNILHIRRPFSGQGAARQTLRFSLEPDQYNNRFAIGMGLIVSGDLTDVAGE